MRAVGSAQHRGHSGVHGGLCFASARGRVDKMYERHKRRYSLCDISKVDRTVDVVLLKVWCLFMSVNLLPPRARPAEPRAGRCGEGDQVEGLAPFGMRTGLCGDTWHEVPRYYLVSK